MRPQRKLAAIVFADIAGFSRQVSEDEVAGLESRRQVEQLIKATSLTHGGRVVKTIGDAVMLEFYSAVEAVSCAVAIQREMRDLNTRLATRPPVLVRIGVHVGDVVEENGDLFGNGVNIAQRVQTLAIPGGICISREVYVQIRPILKLRCELVTAKPDKAMPEPVDVFTVACGTGDSDTLLRPAAAGRPSDSGLILPMGDLQDLDIRSCFRRSWKLVKAHFWLCVMAAFIFNVAYGGATAIKYFGPVLSLALIGPLEGGVIWMMLRAARGQKPQLRDLGVAFGPLFVAAVVTGAASDFLLDLGIWMVFNTSLVSFRGNDADLELLLKFVAIVIIPLIYILVSWRFAQFLVIDRHLDFWPAMELSRKVVSRHWWKVFQLSVTSVAVSVSGILLLGIGFLVTFPIGVGIMIYAYEDTFGNRHSQPPAVPEALPFTEPPEPPAAGGQ